KGNRSSADEAGIRTLMNRVLPILGLLAIGTPLGAAINIPLTIQEALYPGGSSGVSRSNEPFCLGVPIADSAGMKSTYVLGLSGPTTGQSRILGRWASGNVKWVKVCGILASLPAGGKATVTLTDTGSGDFGGPALATGNNPITVATGAAT